MSDKPADFREEYTPPKKEDVKQYSAIVLAFAAVCIGVFIGYLVFGGEYTIGNEHTHAYATNVATEFLSIATTVGLIGIVDWGIRRKVDQRHLVRAVGSRSNERAKTAVEDLWAEGWLIRDNTLLRGRNFNNANLENVDLHGVDLQGTYFVAANLKNALMSGANLKKAVLNAAILQKVDLQIADLEDAVLVAADLKSANLLGADLRRAKLITSRLHSATLSVANLQEAQLNEADLTLAEIDGADLRGACLIGAKLTAASMRDAKLDKYTILPDETHYDPEKGLQQLEQWGVNL